MKKGPEWNTLQEWRCAAPGMFAGEMLSTARGDDSVSRLMGSIFGEVMESPVVMASPGIAAALAAIEASEKKAAA